VLFCVKNCEELSDIVKRVLITGARGLIGRHTTSLLQAKGYEVHAVSSSPIKESGSGVIWHEFDLLDVHRISELIIKIRPSHLLHLAWYVSSGQWSSPNMQHLKWVQSSIELLRSFREQDGERAVFAGTCMEYDWSYGFCSELLTPLNPNTFYGQAKSSLYTLSNAYANEEGMSCAWGRPFFLYGSHENKSRLVPSVIRSLLSSEPARCSHGNQIRDFMFSNDVASAFVALLDSEVTGPVNIASGQPVTLKHIVHKIAKKIGREELVELGAILASPKDMPFVVGDTQRITTEVKWSPEYDLDSGLDMTINWWKQELGL